MSRLWDYLIILNVCVLLLSCNFSSGYKIPQDSANSVIELQVGGGGGGGGVAAVAETARRRRELEYGEAEELEGYARSERAEEGQEEGFWDRVVKVALRMFNRFVQWLNSPE